MIALSGQPDENQKGKEMETLNVQAAAIIVTLFRVNAAPLCILSEQTMRRILDLPSGERTTRSTMAPIADLLLQSGVKMFMDFEADRFVLLRDKSCMALDIPKSDIDDLRKSVRGLAKAASSEIHGIEAGTFAHDVINAGDVVPIPPVPVKEFEREKITSELQLIDSCIARTKKKIIVRAARCAAEKALELVESKRSKNQRSLKREITPTEDDYTILNMQLSELHSLKMSRKLLKKRKKQLG